MNKIYLHDEVARIRWFVNYWLLHIFKFEYDLM